MLNGLYVMDLARFPDVYGEEERAAIEKHLRILAPPLAPAELTPELLADVDVSSPPGEAHNSPLPCSPPLPGSPWSCTAPARSGRS